MFFVIYGFYLCFDGRKRVGVGGDSKNRPKQWQTCRLGPRCVFFHFFEFFITYQLCLELFLYRTSPAHSSAPPSLKMRVRGVFPSFLCQPCPCPLPHSKHEMEGLFFQLPLHLPPPSLYHNHQKRAAGTKKSPNNASDTSFGPYVHVFFII